MILISWFEIISTGFLSSFRDSTFRYGSEQRADIQLTHRLRYT